MTSQCPSCKNQIDERSEVCPYCHKRLNGIEWIITSTPIVGMLIAIIVACYVGWIYSEPLRFALKNFGKEKVLATIEVYEKEQHFPIRINAFSSVRDELPKRIIFSEFIEYRYSIFDSDKKNISAFQKCAERLMPLMNHVYPNASQPFSLKSFGGDDVIDGVSIEKNAINRRVISTNLFAVNTKHPGFLPVYAVCRHETKIPKELYPLIEKNQ